MDGRDSCGVNVAHRFKGTIDTKETTMEMQGTVGPLRNGLKPSQRLLESLLDVQEREGFVSQDAVRDLSAGLGVPLIEAWRVVNFYKVFSLVPRGKHVMTVCMGTACHVRSAPLLLEEFNSRLKVEPGETTPDGLFTLESVNCLGACGVGPVVVLDGEVQPQMSPKRLRRLIRSVLDAEKEVTVHA